MTRLPIGISVPHAGTQVPDFVASYCVLEHHDIVKDGDEGAADIYRLSTLVEEFVTTPIARAILDMNRAEDDRRKDGVVKTHTCWDVPVYREPPPDDVVERLLAEHHRPYHRALSSFARADGVKLAVDCHTMAAHGPPVGPDPGVERPLVCLGDGDGACPRPWVEALQECFARHFDGAVTINQPFAGGHITRSHGREMPWLQLELSRTPAIDAADKRRFVLAALGDWCALSLPAPPRPGTPGAPGSEGARA